MDIRDNIQTESFYQEFSEPTGYGAFDDWDEPEEGDVVLDEYCPNCHHEYDEIDYEYQICHICHYENKIIKNLDQNGKREK